VLTTPFIVLIQSLYYNTTFSTPIKLSLVSYFVVALVIIMKVPICLGVALASNADTTINNIGLFFAAIGVVVTSFYQIVTSSLAFVTTLSGCKQSRRSLI
jgi:solute carrier family 35 protein E3